MTMYQLNKAVHHIYMHRDITMAVRDGDFSAADGFDLTAEERAALVERDFPALWQLGVHPVLLFHLSAVLNPREWYIKEVVPHIQGIPNVWYDYYRTDSKPD